MLCSGKSKYIFVSFVSYRCFRYKFFYLFFHLGLKNRSLCFNFIYLFIYLLQTNVNLCASYLNYFHFFLLISLIGQNLFIKSGAMLKEEATTRNPLDLQAMFLSYNILLNTFSCFILRISSIPAENNLNLTCSQEAQELGDLTFRTRFCVPTNDFFFHFIDYHRLIFIT